MATFNDMMQQQINGALGSLQGAGDRYMQGMGTALDQTTANVGQWRNGMANMNHDTGIGALKASAAMLAPTKTGGFGESLGGALNALGDDRQTAQNFNMDKFDKMSRIDEALGKLRQHKAGLEYDTLDNNVKMMGTLGGQNANLANQKFADQANPYKIDAFKRDADAAQADADFAPLDSSVYMDDDGSFDYTKGATATYQDYLANPQKYKGPQGQKMVAEAMQALQDKQRADTQLEAAGIRANRGGMKNLDVGTMKAIRDKSGIVAKANIALSKTNGIDEALAYASQGPLSSWRMKGSALMGDKGAAKALAAVDQMGLMGLEEVSQYLKPMSDTDAQKALEIYGNPDATVDQKLQGLAIIRHGMKLTSAIEAEEARAMKSGEYYTQEYSPLNNPKVKELFETQGEDLWKIEKKASASGIDYTGVSDAVKAQAEEAIASGKDPAAVKAMLEKMKNGSK